MKPTTSGYAACLLLAAAALPAVVRAGAQPLRGQAVVVSETGNNSYRLEDENGAVEEGMIFPEGYELSTGRGGAMCLLLTPGAVLCVHEDSRLVLEKLAHKPEGLPGPDAPTKRIIRISLERGAVLVHAGAPAPDREITVRLAPDVRVTADGGTFILSVERNRRLVYVEDGRVTTTVGGVPRTVEADHRLTLERPAGGTEWRATTEPARSSGLPYDFHVCRSFFPAVAPLAFHWKPENLGKLNAWAAPALGMRYMGPPPMYADVSPSVRRSAMLASTPAAAPPAPAAGSGPWRRATAWDWYDRTGTIRGVNYIPRTAVNAIEMWRDETFDPDVIREELNWANKSGLDSVRVQLPYTVWKHDPDGLRKRMDRFLSLAHRQGLTTVFVLFDDRRAPGMTPVYGPQPPPLPGVHDSRHTASPGHALVPESSGSWPDLKAYVQDLVRAFRRDKRVLMWDLYNEPGADGMNDTSLPLVRAAFEWAREVQPVQPVTAGVTRRQPPAMREDIMKRSDVITLSDFEDAVHLREFLRTAAIRGRPVICTGWLRRSRRNTVQDVLPVFAQTRTGWYLEGLVSGKTQRIYPLEAAAPSETTTLWEQDLLKPDGTPFDPDEIKLIQGFRFERP